MVSNVVILFFYVIFHYYYNYRFCSAIGFVKFSPILDLAAKFYGVTDNAIIWFSNCYYITYALLSPFSIKPLDIRLDYSLNIASFLTALGSVN